MFKDGYYMKQRYKDEYLGMLSYIFEDGSGWFEGVKRNLLNPNSKGVTGNRSDVTIKGDVVTIQPLYGDDAEDYAIQINRHVLLELIDKWKMLYEKEANEIVFTRHDDGTITISGGDGSVYKK